MTTPTALGVLHGRPDSMLRSLARGGWKERATCRQTDPDLWFADISKRKRARAASICASCPVRRQCLAWALVFDEEYGIWGGLDAAELRPLQRRLTAWESLSAVVADAMPWQAAGGEVA